MRRRYTGSVFIYQLTNNQLFNKFNNMFTIFETKINSDRTFCIILRLYRIIHIHYNFFSAKKKEKS